MRFRHRLPAFAMLALASTAALASGQDAAQAADPDAPARAAVTEALQGAAFAKLAVSEHFARKHEWAADAASVGYKAPEGLPAAVAIAGGAITFTFSGPEAIAGRTLRLVPADGGGGTVRWRCEAPDLPAGAVPEACR